MALMCETALDQYYREHVTRNVVDRRRIEFALAPLERFFTGKKVNEIDIPMCREYRDFREDIADSTVRKELSVLNAAINHAWKWKRITRDQMPYIEMPKAGRGRVLWLFKPELVTLLDTAEKLDWRVYRFCQIAYHTASRKRAVETLPWSRVDESARRADLQDPDLPVTRKRRPIVPLSEAMAQELAIMRSEATTGLVLGNDHDIRPVFDRVAREAGLEHLKSQGLRPAGRLTPHVLRHSRATHLLQDGKKPFAVANLLGDTVQTVLRVYGHACPDYMAEAIGE